MRDAGPRGAPWEDMDPTWWSGHTVGNPLMVIAYEEIIDFIAAGTTPEQVIAFRPSETTRARVTDLIRRRKTAGLSPDERAELSHYLEFEHLMRLAKARARQNVPHE